MTKSYEMMFLLDPQYAEGGLEEKQQRLTQILEGQGGQVSEVQQWGKRELAYEINDESEGLYLLYEFEVSSQAISDVEERSNVEEGVYRYVIVEKNTEPEEEVVQQ